MLYRITKYNPAKRNEQGHYIDPSEWTSVSDIGKPEYHDLSYTEYEKTESAYVNAIKRIMQDNHINCLQVTALELWENRQQIQQHATTIGLKNIIATELKNLHNGTIICGETIGTIIRLILRETIWMALVHEGFELSFGYDYYMYVKTEHILPTTLQEINASGLFVEIVADQN